MADTTYKGTGAIAAGNYIAARWIGRTKGGQTVQIDLFRAICLSNPDWTMAEKDDIVPQIEFTGVYHDDDLAANDRTEPWRLTIADGTTAGNGEIVLGAGKFYIAKSGANYDATADYAVDDVCVHDGAVYVCNTAITGGETWTAAHWTAQTYNAVGLTRGGGQFIVEREYREINADDDPGAVYDRIVQETGRPKLTLNALQWLTKVATLYAGIATV